MNHRFMDRVIDGIELVAAAFVGIVAADIFVAVVLRSTLSWSLTKLFAVPSRSKSKRNEK